MGEQFGSCDVVLLFSFSTLLTLLSDLLARTGADILISNINLLVLYYPFFHKVLVRYAIILEYSLLIISMRIYVYFVRTLDSRSKILTSFRQRLSVIQTVQSLYNQKPICNVEYFRKVLSRVLMELLYKVLPPVIMEVLFEVLALII